jgi:hypothetical protein
MSAVDPASRLLVPRRTKKRRRDARGGDGDCCPGPYHRVGCTVARELRGSWCTPRWLTELIGRVDLDPCGNERSHVLADRTIMWARGEDGLAGDAVDSEEVVFVNPPYGPGQVMRWVKRYRGYRFMFLLRWDPSTEWFAELLPRTTHVWFADRRVDFEPPPRIRCSNNPFPHGLYLRNPDQELLTRLVTRGWVFTVDRSAVDNYMILRRPDIFWKKNPTRADELRPGWATEGTPRNKWRRRKRAALKWLRTPDS